MLGLPLERVRLVHASPGGGFGARNDLSLHPYLALAAVQQGQTAAPRPIKMVLTRAESLRFHTKRHAMEHTLSSAFRNLDEDKMQRIRDILVQANDSIEAIIEE